MAGRFTDMQKVRHFIYQKYFIACSNYIGYTQRKQWSIL